MVRTRELRRGCTEVWVLTLDPDTKTFFSKNYGWDAGMGERNGRWAMCVEKDGTISIADAEEGPGKVTVRLNTAIYPSSDRANGYPRSLAPSLFFRSYKRLVVFTLQMIDVIQIQRNYNLWPAIGVKPPLCFLNRSPPGLLTISARAMSSQKSLAAHITIAL